MPTYPGNKILVPPFRITQPSTTRIGMHGEMILIRDGIDFAMEVCLRKKTNHGVEALWWPMCKGED